MHATVLIVLVSTRDSVDLVEEDDAGTGCSSPLEDLAYGSLALAHVHVEQFGSFDGNEVVAAFRGEGFGRERLGAAWGTVEKDSFAEGDASFFEEGGVLVG
jgi:hypothetical protein